jgi:hypothetical protein
MVVENRKSHRVGALNLDQDEGARTFSASSSLPIQTQISGVGSTVLGNGESAGLRTGYPLAGTDAHDNSSSLNSAIETAPRYAGESSNSPATPQSNVGGSLSSSHTESAPSGYAVSVRSSSNPFAAKSESGSSIPKAISLPGPDSITSGNTTTWTGGGANDDWGTSGNWAFGTTPSGGGDDIINFAGTTRLTPNNNYGAFTQFQSIFFNSGAGSFTLNGNAIKLYGKIENDSSSTQTINFGAALLMAFLIVSASTFMASPSAPPRMPAQPGFDRR